jgi:hypothetical protein
MSSFIKDPQQLSLVKSEITPFLIPINPVEKAQEPCPLDKGARKIQTFPY